MPWVSVFSSATALSRSPLAAEARAPESSRAAVPASSANSAYAAAEEIIWRRSNSFCLAPKAFTSECSVFRRLSVRMTRLRPSITSRRMSASSRSRSVPNVSSRPAGERLRTDHLGGRIPSAARSPPWSRNTALQPCSGQQREHRALLDHHPAMSHPRAGIRRVERGQQLANLVRRRLAPLGGGGAGERRSHLRRSLPTLERGHGGLDQRLRPVADQRR